MPSPKEKRLWMVEARFARSYWSKSDLLTWTQARDLRDAVEAVGMQARIKSWPTPTRAPRRRLAA